jgi:hypothetical protein
VDHDQIQLGVVLEQLTRCTGGIVATCHDGPMRGPLFELSRQAQELRRADLIAKAQADEIGIARQLDDTVEVLHRVEASNRGAMPTSAKRSCEVAERKVLFQIWPNE